MKGSPLCMEGGGWEVEGDKIEAYLRILGEAFLILLMIQNGKSRIVFCILSLYTLLLLLSVGVL